MTRQYNVEEIMGNKIIWFEKNGIRYSFSTDPANSDYQRYLRWLENPDADETGGIN